MTVVAAVVVEEEEDVDVELEAEVAGEVAAEVAGLVAEVVAGLVDVVEVEAGFRFAWIADISGQAPPPHVFLKCVTSSSASIISWPSTGYA